MLTNGYMQGFKYACTLRIHVCTRGMKPNWKRQSWWREKTFKEQKTSPVEWNWKMKAIVWGVSSSAQQAENKNGLVKRGPLLRALLHLFTYESLPMRNHVEKWINRKPRSVFTVKRACAPLVFFCSSRTRTMSRFHADVSRELRLNNWCWTHYCQAYAAGGKNDLAARDRQVRGFRFLWTLRDGNTRQLVR